MEKKGLSKREKWLLLIMVVFGVFALMVVYIIVPMNDELNDKETKRSELEFEKLRIEQTLMLESSTRDSLDEAKGTHKGVAARFLSESSVSEIGRMLTELCEEHNLFPISLNTTAPVGFTTGGKDREEAAKLAAESAFSIVTASMTVSGGYDSLKSLLDTAEQTEYLRVSRVSFGRNVDDWPEVGNISITFEVTMLKDAATESPKA